MVHREWALACVTDLITAWNRRDWCAVETLYAPDVVYESPHAPPVLGRRAMRCRDEELVAIVPDLRDSDLRLISNDSAGNWAMFTFVQTGTLSPDLPTPEGGLRRAGSPFEVNTTMFVRFDDDGRVASLRTAHE
jgi:ketosteroid isomerase-like protein